MVLVTANPVQFNVVSVQEKSFILVKGKCPDPEGSADAVDQLPARFQQRDKSIQDGRLQ